MKKFISLILVMAMLCSMCVMPAAAQTDRENLLERELQYIDIISTARAGTATPAFRDSFKKDASLYHSTEPSVFTQNKTDTQYHEILNTMWIGFGYKGASFTGTNQTVHFFDITNSEYEVIGTGTSTGTRAKIIDTEGVISYERGEAEEYDVNYYKFGNYKLGPVSVEDDDPATDVFYSPNTVYLGGNSEGGSISTQTFEDLNVKGKYLNLLLNTFEFEGDASIIPVKVDYTTGDPETFYVFTTKNISADRLSTLVKVLPKKAEGTYTQQELVDNKNNFVYLTAEKREELGITAEDIDEITFDGLAEGVSLIFPEKTALMFCNRNKDGAEAKNVYVEDITLPLDADREVSKVTITSWYAATEVDAVVAPYDERLSSQSTTTYHKLTIPGYEGDNEFYALFGRTCQKRSVLLGMSVLSENDAEKITKINEKLNAINVETITAKECENLRLEIAQLKSENSVITDADFDTSKLVQAEERIAKEEADAEKENALNDNHPEYVELYLFQDVFATHKERMSADWYEWTAGEGEITKIWPYKGITNNISPAYPYSRTKNTNEWAMMIDATGSTASSYNNPVALNTNPRVSYDETLGRYIVTAGNVKYKLGEIAEGKKGGNYATFGVVYDITSNEIADGIGIKEQTLNADVYPNIGTSTRVTKAIYPVNKSGVTEINLLMGTMQTSEASKGRTARVPATIEYTDGYKEEIALLVGDIGASVQEAIVASAKTNTTYAAVEADKVSAKTVLGKDIKNADITAIPSTKGTVYLPEENFILATHMRSYSSGAFDGYVNSFTIPVDPQRTIKTVTFEQDSNTPTNYFSDYYQSTTDGNDRIAFVPVTIKDAPTDTYNYYIEVMRSCGSSGIFAMTLTYPSLLDEIEALENRIEALSDTFAEEEAEEVVAIKAAYDELLEEEYVTAADFDTALIAKLNNLILQAEEAAKQKIVKAVEDKIDGLSDNFVKEELEKINEAEKAYNDALTNANITAGDFDAIKIAKLNTLIAASARYAELIQGDKFTPAKLKIAEGKTDSYTVKFFEDEAYTCFADTVENATTYAVVKDNKYMATRPDASKNEAPRTVAQWLAQDATATLKTAFQFYSKELLAEDNSYTTAKGTKYVIDTIGDTNDTAGMLKHAEADTYVAEFDGVTEYKSVNLLMAGIDEPVWAGSNRLAKAASATINYADGTSEKKLLIVGSTQGYVPTVLGKLKTSAQIEGKNLNAAEGIFASDKQFTLSVNESTGKETKKNKADYVYRPLTGPVLEKNKANTWTPSWANSETVVFSDGFFTGGYANQTSNADRAGYILKEMPNSGHLTSITLDTKGKAVTSVTIGALGSDSHFDELAPEYDAFRFSGDNNSWTYRIPVDIEEVKAVIGEDTVAPFGDLYMFDAEGNIEKETVNVNETDYQIGKKYNSYTINDCDTYIIASGQANSYFSALVAVSGEKKYSNLYEYIEEAENAMSAITENSSIEDAAAAKEIYDLARNQTGVMPADFNAQVVANFTSAYEAIRQKTDVKGELSVNFFENAPATVNVKLTNLAELPGKPYAVLLTYLDEKGFVVGSESFTGISTVLKNQVATFTATKPAPETAVKAKAYIWKALGSLKPLGNAVEVGKTSYALDNFFDETTGQFKKSEGDLNIVFIGDSLTQGATTYDGDDSALTDAQQLHWTKVISDYFAEQTGRTVNMYNAGVGGVQTSFLTKMISQTVEKTDADIIFIENVNDLNNGSKTNVSQQWTENLIRNISKLDKKPVVIMAHAVSPFKDKSLQDNHINAKDTVAKAYNLASVNYMQYYYDNTNGFDTTSDWMQTDYGETKIAKSDVHPLPTGYNRFGNYIVSQISANPKAFITRITPAEDVEVMHEETADLSYTLTYPTSSRFTYEGFNLYTKSNKLTGYTKEDAEYLIDWKYNFPHGGASQAITTNGGASIEFTTDAKAVEIVHSCPSVANRRADFIVYVDGVEKVNNTTSNTYANVLNTTAVELDGLGSHKIKVEVKQDATAVKNVFNFAYIVEQK